MFIGLRKKCRFPHKLQYWYANHLMQSISRPLSFSLVWTIGSEVEFSIFCATDTGILNLDRWHSHLDRLVIVLDLEVKICFCPWNWGTRTTCHFVFPTLDSLDFPQEMSWRCHQGATKSLLKWGGWKGFLCCLIVI